MEQELKEYIDKEISIVLKNGLRVNGAIFAVNSKVVKLSIGDYIETVLTDEIAMISYDTKPGKK